MLAVAATALLRDRTGIGLGVESQAEQEVGATVLEPRRRTAAELTSDDTGRDLTR